VVPELDVIPPLARPAVAPVPPVSAPPVAVLTLPPVPPVKDAPPEPPVWLVVAVAPAELVEPDVRGGPPAADWPAKPPADPPCAPLDVVVPPAEETAPVDKPPLPPEAPPVLPPFEPDEQAEAVRSTTTQILARENMRSSYLMAPLVGAERWDGPHARPTPHAAICPSSRQVQG
jgi:hypothetical protein